MSLKIPPPNNPVFQNLLPTVSMKCGFSSDNPEKANKVEPPALLASDVRGKTAFHQADNVELTMASKNTALSGIFSCFKLLLLLSFSFSFITLLVIMLMPGLSFVEKIGYILVVVTLLCALSGIFAKLIAALA